MRRDETPDLEREIKERLAIAERSAAAALKSLQPRRALLKDFIRTVA